MLKKIKAHWLHLIFLLFLLLSPIAQANASGLVPCGTGATDPCTLCHLIVGIKGLLDFGMGLLVVAAITGISISGIMYIVSGGSTTLVGQAKSFMTNVVIGFALMLGAWLIVYTTLSIFSAKSDLGIGKSSWNSFECSTVSSSTATTTTGQGGVPATPVPSSGMNFQSGIENQYNADASSELQTMLGCMYNNIPTGSATPFFQISSISDSNGGATCYDKYSTQCTSDPQSNCCYHKKSSCHYGGTTCKGKSYAADISTKGSKATQTQIETIAKNCGAKYLNEGNHAHISIPGGCGCDSSL